MKRRPHAGRLFLLLFSRQPAEQSQLVEEDDADGNRTEVFHEEGVSVEEVEGDRALVGQLRFQYLFIYPLSDKQADQHTAQRKHDLGGDVIQQVEEVEAANGVFTEHTHRKGADRAKEQHAQRDIDSCAAAGHLPLLVHVGRGYLVERDGGGEGG